MTFEVSGELNVSVDRGSLRSTRGVIEQELSDITIGANTGGLMSGGPAGGATSAASGVGVGSLLESQNEILTDIHDTLEKGSISGGGGGGGILGSLTGGGGGDGGGILTGVGIGSLLGKTKLSTVIKKVPFKRVLTKVPALTTLIGTGYLFSEFVQGDLTASDITDATIKIGNLVTGGLAPNDFIAGAVGGASAGYGIIQIGKLITGTLGSSALSGYLGSVSIGGILTGLSAGTAAVGLVALLGTVALADLLADGKLDTWKYVKDTPIGDVIVGGINLADRISPEPLDKFLKSQKKSFDNFYEQVNTGDLGPVHQRKTVNPESTSQTTEAETIAEYFANNSTDTGGGATGNNTQQNRAAERRNNQSLEIDSEHRVVVEDRRDLERKLDQVKQETLTEAERWLQGGP